MEIKLLISDGCEVRSSTVSGANMGLFVAERTLEGTCICEYSGETLNFSEACKRKQRSYMKMVHLNMHIDAVNPSISSVGRYANDNLDRGKINARFVSINEKVFIKAIRELDRGEEIFISYGRGHWLFCTDLSLSEGFLGLKLADTMKAGVVAKQDFDQGEILCIYSSVLWGRNERFGCGLGGAIVYAEQKENINCEIIKNPFISDTFMVRSLKPIKKNESLYI
jgi:hypothetical protein